MCVFQELRSVIYGYYYLFQEKSDQGAIDPKMVNLSKLMGEVIFFIFARLFGGRRRADKEKPRPNHEDYSPLRSYCIDIIQEHNLETAAVAAAIAVHRNRNYHVVTISPHQQQQQEAVLDPLIEDGLHSSLTATNSTVASTADVEGTEELITKSKAEEAFHPCHRVVAISPQQQEAVLDPLVDDDLYQPVITTNSTVASTAGVEGTKELITKSTAEEPFRPCHRVVTISPQQQVVLDPLVDDLRQPFITTNSTVAGTPGVEGTKELIVKSTIQEAFRPQHRVVTCSPQQGRSVLDPLVHDDLCQPLRATNSIVPTAAGGVKGAKELSVKATTEKVISTEKKKKKKKKKKGPKNDELAERKIGPYVSTQKILLVGEGDFSFSAALAVAFGNAFNIIATSLNDKVFLVKNYKRSMANIEILESMGALVIHELDATNMASHKLLRGMKFDRIVFNFPHTSSFGRTSSHYDDNKDLVVGFLRNAKNMIKKYGEIHVTHKTSPAYIKWNIVYLALMEDLNLIEACPFNPRLFPGYDTKYGHGGDKNFDWYPCNSYKFGLIC